MPFISQRVPNRTPVQTKPAEEEKLVCGDKEAGKTIIDFYCEGSEEIIFPWDMSKVEEAIKESHSHLK